MRTWIEPLGWMLVHSVWLISLIVAVAAVVLSILRRRSANARYLVGCVALMLSVSVLPSVFAWVMAQPREVPQPVVVGEKEIDVNTTDAVAWDGAGQGFRIDADPDFAPQPRVTQPQHTTDNGPRTTHAEVVVHDESAIRSPVEEPTTWQRIETRLRPHLAWLVSGWLVGVCLLTLRPLIGWHATWRLRRVGLSEVPESVSATLHRLAERLGLRRATKVFQSSLVRIPCVIGAFKPVILLPASALTGLSADQLEALLAHELAHIRRHDFAVNVVQTLVETLLFYHPAIWWLSRRIRQEREHCCDDLAISVCGDVAGYARMLVSIENLRGRVPQASVAASGGSLVERVRRLLPAEPRQVRAPWLSVIIVLVTFAVLAGSWQWTVGQVSNPPVKTVVESKIVSDNPTQKAVGQVENLPHKDWPQWGRTSQRNNVAEGRLPLDWNLEKGTNIVWQAKLGSQTYSSPIVSGGKVFIGTNNASGLNPAHSNEKDLSCLVCFDEATGKLLWQYASEKLPAGRSFDWPMIGLSSTAYADGDRVWVVTNRCEVVCLDANGFRDGENDGPFRDEPAQTEIDADVIWKFDMFGELGVRPLHQSVSSITMVDGVLLLNTSNGPDESYQKAAAPHAPNFLALDAITGRVIWKDNSAGESIVVGGSACMCSGASPAVATLGCVTQAIFTGKEGWVYGYDFNDLKLGKTTLLWKFDCNPKTGHYLLGSKSRRHPLVASPIVADGRVYVATGRNPEHGEGEADLWCIDPTKRGDLSTELVFNKSFENGEQPIPHKPIRACEIDKGDFVRPNPNSGAIWHYAKADRNGNGKIEFEETFHCTMGSPVIHDGLLFIADFSGLMHCLDAKTGEVQWTHDLISATYATCVVADSHVLIGDEDGDVEIFKVARTKQSVFGDTLPNFNQSVYATPALVEGTLFVASKSTLVAIRDPKQVATKEADDDLFVTVSRGQSLNLEFDQKVKSVEGFDVQMLKVTALSPTSLRVESVNVGLTIVTVTDDKGTEFAIPIEVLPEAKPALSPPTMASFRPKPRKNPLLRPLVIRQNETSVELGVQQPRFLDFPKRLLRVDGIDPLVLDVSVASSQQLRERGLTAGTTTDARRSRNDPLLRVRGLTAGTTKFVAETEEGNHTVEVVVKPGQLNREKIRKLFAADDGELPNPVSRIAKPTPASWTSFRHDLAQTGVSSSPLPDKLELLWEANLGDQVVGTAAIVGDHVYVPCLSGELVCLDRKNGRKLWAYRSVSEVKPNSFRPGFQASPTVTAEAIYLGDEDGVFHAIDRMTGKARWTFKTDGEIFSSAAVVNESKKVLFGSYDSHLYCLNESDGKMVWKFATQGRVHCAPAVIDGLVLIAGCDEHLRVIDIATGAEKKDILLASYLIASPAIVGDLVFVGTYGSEVLAVNRTSGDIAWRYSPGKGEFPFHSSAAVTDKLVVLGGHDKLMHGIDRATGQGLWKFATRGKVESSPVVVGQRVFIGSDDGNLYELDATTGELRATFNLGKPISASPAIGEGVLVIGSKSNDGRVVCYGGPALGAGLSTKPNKETRAEHDAVPQEPQLGTFSGRFLYDGVPPVPKDLFSGIGNGPTKLQPGQRVSGEASVYRDYLARKVRPSTTDPSLLVSKEGGIANVIVWVVSKDIPWTAPQDGLKAAAIRVKDGNYSPRITAVTVGQPLHLENHDPDSFNFRLIAVRNDAVNMLLPPSSINHPERLTFRMSEKLPVMFRSDQAIWATGLLLIRDNPFVAISQPDGSFSMPNLPPGEWEFRAWHERKGYLQHWPKGLFNHTIKPGDNSLGTIKLKSEFFSEPVAAAAAVAPQAPATAAKHSGRVTGTIHVAGDVPPVSPIVGRKDHWRGVPMKVPNETLLVSQERGLANAFVYLKKAPVDFASEPPPSEPFVLTNEAPRFSPHVALMRAGQPVVLKNVDSQMTSVRWQPIRNNSLNMLLKPDESRDVSAAQIQKPETIPLTIASDLQPWKQAFVLPLDHPFAAVTDSAGRFEISGLPPGEHDFTIWHERVGYLEKKLKVSVKEGQTTVVPPLSYPFARFDSIESTYGGAASRTKGSEGGSVEVAWTSRSSEFVVGQQDRNDSVTFQLSLRNNTAEPLTVSVPESLTWDLGMSNDRVLNVRVHGHGQKKLTLAADEVRVFDVPQPTLSLTDIEPGFWRVHFTTPFARYFLGLDLWLDAPPPRWLTKPVEERRVAHTHPDAAYQDIRWGQLQQGLRLGVRIKSDPADATRIAVDKSKRSSLVWTERDSLKLIPEFFLWNTTDADIEISMLHHTPLDWNFQLTTFHGSEAFREDVPRPTQIPTGPKTEEKHHLKSGTVLRLGDRLLHVVPINSNSPINEQTVKLKPRDYAFSSFLNLHRTDQPHLNLHLESGLQRLVIEAAKRPNQEGSSPFLDFRIDLFK